MVKKIKEEYFVQIGLKRNGRIVKNKQYKPQEFINLIIKNPIYIKSIRKIAWFNIFTKKSLIRYKKNLMFIQK